MATYHFINGPQVRTLESTFNGANLDVAHRWVSVDPVKRAVYSESKGLWYRAGKNGWGTPQKAEPKAITMSRMVEAITKTNWKEVESEIPPNPFFSG